MIIRNLSKKIIAFEIIGICAILAIFWLDEFLDLPHVLFGAPPTPVNIMENFIETVVIFFFGFLIVIVTVYLLEKIVELERKRQDLERIFFHDILNITTGINLIAELLVKNKVNVEDSSAAIYNSSKILIDEIENQRDMILAESDRLKIKLSPLQSNPFLLAIVQIYKNHKSAGKKQIILSPDTQDVGFISDNNMLKRVMGNLLINALEASEDGQTVTLGCRSTSTRISFWCHNNTYIPKEIQKKLFKKIYSAKGKRRGIGTYSIKILTEKYLRGKVTCVSTQTNGTTFTVSYPLSY
ncbi:MAG: HAMP domain-containing sensor histidine kinase [Candidatus Omnitrophota bacterium]